MRVLILFTLCFAVALATENGEPGVAETTAPTATDTAAMIGTTAATTMATLQNLQRSVKEGDPDMIGKEVVAGSDWQGTDFGVGFIEVDHEDGWVAVRWLSTSQQHDYRVGDEDKFELYYAGEKTACTMETPCPIMGKMSEWTTWSASSASCGLGRRRRHRTCTIEDGTRICGETKTEDYQIQHHGNCPAQMKTTALGAKCHSPCSRGRDSFSWCYTNWAHRWDKCCNVDSTCNDQEQCQSGTDLIPCKKHRNSNRGNGQSVSLEEVVFEGGTPGATSEAGIWGLDWSASRAFQRQSAETKPWMSGPINDAEDATVYYSFAEPITVGNFSFRNRREPRHMTNNPLAFDFVGSDDCSSWTTIKAVDSVNWSSNDEQKNWSIPKNDRKKFKCFGIRVHRISGKWHAGIQDIKMWKEKRRHCTNGNGNCQPPTMLKLQNGHASSNWDGRYTAAHAFKSNSYWHPKRGTRLPQTVYNIFDTKAQVSEFTLVGGKNADHFPRSFTFFGSNAQDCLNEEDWEFQRHYNDIEYNDRKIFKDEVESPKYFRCYGIRVESARHNQYTAIEKIEILGSEYRNQATSSSCSCSNGREDSEMQTLNADSDVWPKNCGTVVGVQRQKRIVNGQISYVNNHPWQVQIERQESGRWNHFCGGTLIKEDVVLSAAHCFDSLKSGIYQKSDFRIVTGQQRVLWPDDTEDIYDIDQLIVHEGFDESYRNDIALLTFRRGSSGNFALPACLPNPLILDYSNDIIGQRLSVSGYGTTELGQQYATELRSANVTVISTTQCQHEFRASPHNFNYANHVDRSANLCGKDGTTSAASAAADCVGDSGGPVIAKKGHKFVLVGIISWGQGCKDSTNHFPSVYTRVRCYLKWIHEKLEMEYDECSSQY